MVEIVFITSNREKLAHARYLAREFDIYISKQKNYGIGYVEPRVGDRDELFEKSIGDAYSRWKKNVSRPEEKLFFIEDTSVNIPALSSPGKEYPVLEIKYWMKMNTFNSVDNLLLESGNNRSVIVRSDLALVLSADLEKQFGKLYKIFTSQVSGQIIDKELKFETQPYFSWLSAKTFNKWFIPHGASEPISLLPIKEADKYDFRAEAFKDMVLFLESHGKIKRRNSKLTLVVKPQQSLFNQPVLVVCGPSCAGKTTIAEYLVQNFNFYHFEASDFMYVRFFEHHGTGSAISIGDFASVALEVDPSIVVDQIIHHIPLVNNFPIIITGFRSENEVAAFKQKYSSNQSLFEIYVDANQEVRYKRSSERARGRNRTLEKFAQDGLQQEKMGLVKIKDKFSNHLVNEGSKDEYYKSFMDIMPLKLDRRILGGVQTDRRTLKLEEAIILSLHLSKDKDKYYTTNEIANLISIHFKSHRKSKNNVSRYFNQNVHPYFEIELRERTNTYRLSQTGQSHAIFLGKN